MSLIRAACFVQRMNGTLIIMRWVENQESGDCERLHTLLHFCSSKQRMKSAYL
jgi:hypothetical protein